MPSQSTQGFSDARNRRPAPKLTVREFRAFQKKLILSKYKTYRNAAEKLCEGADPDFLPELIEKRTRQIEHYLNDPDDGDPRASLAKAIEELTDCPLPASDYGWDPRVP